MIAFTQEQAKLYEHLITEEPMFASWPINRVGMHTVNDKRVLCIETREPDGKLGWLHAAMGNMTTQDMAELTLMHDSWHFSCEDGEGFVLTEGQFEDLIR